MTNYYSEHSKFFVSVDCIIFGFTEGELKILIARRKMDPGRGEWSLYGGFVNEDESVDDAAQRVVYELTGLRNLYMKQVGTFGRVDRDPGERVISVAYYTLINVNDYDKALQEKYEAVWINVNDVPQMYSDHNTMVKEAHLLMKSKLSSQPIIIRLLPELFTLTQLQKVYESIHGTTVDKRNFRKRVSEMDFIEKTERIDKTGSKRGARLYKFNDKAYANDPTFKL